MKTEFCQVLDSHADELCLQLDVDSGILNRLLAKGIITSEHVADIKAEKTARRKNEVLLDILKKRDDKFFIPFRDEVSKEQKQLAEQCLPLPHECLPHPCEESSQ